MSYWDVTDTYLRRHGKPDCPNCGKEMFAEDDHGRFMCCCGARKDVVSGEYHIPLKALSSLETPDLNDIEKEKSPEGP